MADQFVIVRDDLPRIVVALHKGLAKHVGDIAYAIMVQAQQYAPVLSGFLSSSIYMVTKDESTYGQDVVPPPGDSYLLDEVDAPSSDQVAYVAVGANYGIFVEMGTSRMMEQPFLLPAAQQLEADFVNGLNLEAVMKRLAGL